MTDKKNISDFVCVDTASSSTDDCPTPSTTMSEDMPIRERKDGIIKNDDGSSDSKPDKTKATKPSHNNHVNHIEHHPIPGRTFIIRTRQEPHRILGLQYGAINFFNAPTPYSGIIWYCYDNDNWHGFINATAGTYLNHDGAGNITVAKANYHDQYLIPIRQESGGYILQTFHPEKKELWQVAVSDNGISLVERKSGGTAFDFIDAKYVRSSVSLALPNMEEEDLSKPKSVCRQTR